MAMIDSFAQLRLVLHLFHALKLTGHFRHGQIPFLDRLFAQFLGVKGMWEGALPELGKLTTRWFITWGVKTSDAKRWSKSVEERTFKFDSVRGLYSSTRSMTPMNPEDISKSFRRICAHDFDGVIDNYHNERQKREQTGTVIYEHAVRSNDTLDAIEAEQAFLATNLIAVGETLNLFIDSLFRVLGLEQTVKELVRTTPASVRAARRTDGRSVSATSWEASEDNLVRQAQANIFAMMLLGPLDFMQDGPKHPEHGGDLKALTAHFMDVFFNRLNPENIMWFVPLEED
uniref:Uncharacterized protein n=1 Tax=Grammatophora oceanica TaxID=210454 RepID=A0A7S1VVT7_9STRA|mmetsp:Transcript_7676/g.11206  ORF Transcript_7676/g.11206 Transcript_7676/m.11206 type:complete len:287 (+) Transcript_7676:1-861(+)